MGFIPDPSNSKHFWAGVIISMATFIFLSMWDVDVWWNIVISFIAPILIGFFKEIYDRHIRKSLYRHFDVLDWIFTGMGGAIGCGYIMIAHWLILVYHYLA